MTICASYERVSTRIQGQHGFSLGAQHASLAEFAQAQGWQLPERLRFRDGEDENASGADWDLPDLTRMFETARRGEFAVLLVPDFDRFARSLTKGLVLEEQLKKYGVRVVFQRVPVEDSPEGQLLKTQLYAFAEYDRQKIVLRTTMGRRAKASLGKVVGTSTAKYGYRYVRETLPNGKDRVCGLEHDPVTAPVAREALLALRYRSTNDVANELNARSIPTPQGGPWTGARLRSMTYSDVYTGTWHYGAIAVPVAPLLSDDEAAQIRTALVARRNARRGRRPVEDDPFVLRGRLICGTCHRPPQAEFNAGYRYYRCGCAYASTAREFGRPVCGLPAVNAPALEDELWRVLSLTLLNADFLAADLADAGEGEFRASIRRRAQEIESIIVRLCHDRDELAAVPRARLSAADADAITHFAAEIQAGMEHATPAERRMLYQQLQIRGSVLPADRHDTTAIRLGRHHRFRVDWTASIPLLDSDGSFLYMIAQSSRSEAPLSASHWSNVSTLSN